jgi:hypothetical protein
MPIEDRASVFLDLLRRARVPRKQLTAIEAAYQKEPDATAFGMAQAVTRAAQGFSSETRFDLERAASTYLAERPSA